MRELFKEYGRNMRILYDMNRRCLGRGALIFFVICVWAILLVNSKDLMAANQIEIFSGGKRFKSMMDYRQYQRKQGPEVSQDNPEKQLQEKSKDVFLGRDDSPYLNQMQAMLNEYLRNHKGPNLSFQLDPAKIKTIIIDGGELSTKVKHLP